MPELHALRMVEMQLNAPAVRVEDEGWDQERTPTPSQNPAIRACEARRCHVCQAKYPAFGFGPPLTRPGRELWACGPHRDEVERALRCQPVLTFVAAAQLPLL